MRHHLDIEDATISGIPGLWASCSCGDFSTYSTTRGTRAVHDLEEAHDVHVSAARAEQRAGDRGDLYAQVLRDLG